ncbi:hypothetical protein OEA41_009584 [Lepraria neglecta]|uniref:NACHT-NTPase and P-loop NTPases N-terminal domain-containing protein n=1 Tax=Lepraria neglecta TaxID=209136 RepID=A0AAD9Z637_9LECA|nr:hypothetical protein OEA41_009584 [Lepraria neglecta]
MVVAMVTSFSPNDVPGLDLSRLYPLSDVASYEQMWVAAQSVLHRCLDIRQTGWSAVGIKIVTRLSELSADVEEVPKTFRQIKTQLSLTIDTLEQTKVQADAHQVSEATAKALKPVIDECTVIVKQLEEVLAKALPSKKDSNWRRRVKALSSLAQDKKVAQLQASLERHISILTYYQIIDIAKTSRQLPIHPGTQEPKPASQPTRPHPYFMVHFEQDPNFVGREAELDEIDAIFKQQHRVVLSGIGGVGDRRFGERLAPGKRPISVEPFEMEDAECLLSKKLEVIGTDNEALSRELLRALDFLPLAITQATAFLMENDISVAEYHDILQNNDAEMKAPCYRQAVFEKLLYQETESRIDLVAAIGVLKTFSLIKADSGSRTFRMHRLIQLATQRWLELGTIDEWQDMALVSVYDCITQGKVYDLYRNWETISPHVIKVLDSGAGKTHIRTKSHLLIRACVLGNEASYDIFQGRNEAAQRRRTEALNLDQKFLAPDSVEVIKCMSRVAEDLQPDAAERMLREALSRYEHRSESQEYEKVMKNCLNRLGILLLNEGGAVEAEEFFESCAGSVLLISMVLTARVPVWKFPA